MYVCFYACLHLTSVYACLFLYVCFCPYVLKMSIVISPPPFLIHFNFTFSLHFNSSARPWWQCVMPRSTSLTSQQNRRTRVCTRTPVVSPTKWRTGSATSCPVGDSNGCYKWYFWYFFILLYCSSLWKTYSPVLFWLTIKITVCHYHCKITLKNSFFLYTLTTGIKKVCFCPLYFFQNCYYF